MKNREGTQLGNYMILRLLGRGGYADVYLGKHIYLGTEVAIKLLHTQLSDSDLRAFQNEAKTIESLSHPHIIRIRDFGIQDGFPFIVMKYAPNGTLRERHPQGTRLPLATIVSYISQISSALQYAHDHKIVHRDVKPENMLVEHDNNIWLSDFGIAVTAHRVISLTSQSEAGTTVYMAPEQIMGKAQPASDQYALGVVVYEWLCGIRPFQGTSLMEIAYKHMNQPPPPLYTYLPAIDTKVESIILKALEKPPELRFPSVQNFAEALHACLQAQAARTVSLYEPTEPRLRQLQSAQVSNEQTQRAFHPPTQNIPFIQQPMAAAEDDITQYETYKKESKRVHSRGITRRDLITAGIGGAIVLASEGASYLFTHLPPSPPFDTYPGHNTVLETVAWSPKVNHIASGGFDTKIQVWNFPTKLGVITHRGHTDTVQRIAWSPDGKTIASGSYDTTVKVWDMFTVEAKLTYTEHKDRVWGVAWSPDGSYIASGSYDKTIHIWEAATKKVIKVYDAPGAVQSVSWSPDGKRLAAGLDGWAQVIDVATGKCILDYPGHNGLSVYSVAWSPDGTHIASSSSDQTVQIWDAKTAANYFSIGEYNNSVWGVAWSPNGTYIAATSKDKTIQMWNAKTQSHLATHTGNGFLTGVTWSPDNKYYAAASFDKTVWIWSVE